MSGASYIAPIGRRLNTIELGRGRTTGYRKRW